MTFHLRHDTESSGAMSFLVVDETGREIEWATRFLDVQRVSGKGTLTLRSYGYQMLHFIRWWSRQPGVDVHRLEASQFTESTLLDYAERTQTCSGAVAGATQAIAREHQYAVEHAASLVPVFL